MAKRIEGITIELNGETTGLNKALADVNKRSRDVSGELREVDKLLKFNPGNTDLIAQKQRLLATQVENTSDKLNQLRSAQSQVDAQFKSGNLGEDKYRAFQREIIKTSSQLDGLRESLRQVGNGSSVDKVSQDLRNVKKDADKAESSVSELGSALGGLAAGVGVGGAVQQALDSASLDTNIEISMNVPPESMDAVREAVRSVEAYGLDAAEALEGTRRQWALNADATDEANAKVVQGAGVIARAYAGIDFTELIQETNEIASELGITNEEALGLTNALLKVGFPPEQLDIISEYGGQLQRAGYDAEQVQGIIAAGVETGTWNIDNLLDGLKEGRILISEFGTGVDDATAKVLEGTGISANQLQTWGQAVSQGGEAGMLAMQEVAQALANVDDATKQNELGVALFGTMWEDQGLNITDTLLNMNNHLATAKGNQDQLNTATQALNSDPAVQFQQAMIDLQEALRPLLEVVANVVSQIASWMSANPQLASTIVAIVTILGILIGIAAALAPIFTLIATATGVAGAGFTALLVPIGAVIAIIGALAVAAYLIIDNWGAISSFFSTLWENVTTTFTSALSSISEFLSSTWSSIRSVLEPIWLSIAAFFTSIWTSVQTVTSTIWNGLVSFLQNIWIIIKNVFVGGFAVLLSLVTGQWGQAWDITVQVWNNILGALRNIWSQLSSVFTQGFALLRSIVSTSWDAIRTFFTQTLTTIVSDTISKFTSLGTSVFNALKSIPSYIQQIWNMVMNFLRGIDLGQIGKDMIQGLINGIISMGSSLVGSIKGVVDGAIQGAKDLLDINSPSKVFYGMGEFTGEGYENGLRAMGGRIEQASRDMTESAIIPTDPQFDPSGGTPGNNGGGDGSGGAPVININIENMNGDQESIRELSRQLAALLEKDKRGKGGG